MKSKIRFTFILKYRSHEPVATHGVSGNTISKISIIQYAKGQHSHQYMAVGDDTGNLVVLQVPKSLVKPHKSEVGLFGYYFHHFRNQLCVFSLIVK